MSELPIQYNFADDAIAALKERCMSLRIVSLDDATGRDEVKAALKEVKRYRIDIEKKRKELKEDSLAWGRKVDAEAKRLTMLIEPIERHLEMQEAPIKAEEERIKMEAEVARRKKIDERVAALAAIGSSMPLHELEGYPEAAWKILVADLTRQHEEKVAREAAQREELRKAQEELMVLRREREMEEAKRIAATQRTKVEPPPVNTRASVLLALRDRLLDVIDETSELGQDDTQELRAGIYQIFEALPTGLEVLP